MHFLCQQVNIMSLLFKTAPIRLTLCSMVGFQLNLSINIACVNRALAVALDFWYCSLVIYSTSLLNRTLTLRESSTFAKRAENDGYFSYLGPAVVYQGSRRFCPLWLSSMHSWRYVSLYSTITFPFNSRVVSTTRCPLLRWESGLD